VAIYLLFGLSLISDFPFIRKLNTSTDKPDPSRLMPVYFACNNIPPFPVIWEEGNVVYSQRYRSANGESWDKLYHFADYDVICFAGGMDFYLHDNNIDCHIGNSTNQGLVELYLLGAVLAFWLEKQGIPTLHTSAVVVNGKVVAFPSHSGNGKSTLASAFLQAGASLLTDDILPMENKANGFWGRPGLPQINLWPDEVAHFVETSEEIDGLFPGLLKRQIPVGWRILS
jgi:hypothetical protein